MAGACAGSADAGEADSRSRGRGAGFGSACAPSLESLGDGRGRSARERSRVCSRGADRAAGAGQGVARYATEGARVRGGRRGLPGSRVGSFSRGAVSLHVVLAHFARVPRGERGERGHGDREVPPGRSRAASARALRLAHSPERRTARRDLVVPLRLLGMARHEGSETGSSTRALGMRRCLVRGSGSVESDEPHDRLRCARDSFWVQLAWRMWRPLRPISERHG